MKQHKTLNVDFDMAPVMQLQNGMMIAGEWQDTYRTTLTATWKANDILERESWPGTKLFVYLKDFGDGEIVMDFSDIKTIERGGSIIAFIRLDEP